MINSVGYTYSDLFLKIWKLFLTLAVSSIISGLYVSFSIVVSRFWLMLIERVLVLVVDRTRKPPRWSLLNSEKLGVLIWECFRFECIVGI